MLSPIYKIALISEDPKITSNFYRDRFSYKEVLSDRTPSDSVLLQSSGPLLHIISQKCTDALCGLHHIAFLVDDLETESSRLEQGGASRLTSVSLRLYDAPSAIFLRDRQGVLLQLVHCEDALFKPEA